VRLGYGLGVAVPYFLFADNAPFQHRIPMASHLIIGISGQDGAYLAANLLADGQQVLGTSRSENHRRLPNLARLGIADQVSVCRCEAHDTHAIGRLIEQHDIRRVYLLAGQSSVGVSFARPVETHHGIVTPALQILDLIRTRFPVTRLLYAGSGEVFDSADGMPFTERSRHSPKSPYAAAKSAAMCLVDTYRSAYGIFAGTAILFNHESPLRPTHFVIPKIIAAAQRMADGSAETLTLGNTDVFRDWGWAPDYVAAMRGIIEHSQPDDFVVATGESHSIRDVIDHVGRYFALDLVARCQANPALMRPFDAPVVSADPSKARVVLGWRAEVRFAELIRRLCHGFASSGDDVVQAEDST
jgi:GDPmannose 4,6-dehydratase